MVESYATISDVEVAKRKWELQAHFKSLGKIDQLLKGLQIILQNIGEIIGHLLK